MSDVESASFSETASANNAAPPNGAPEGMAPSGINDTLRETMAAIKREWNRSHPTATSAGSANAQTLSYAANPSAYVRGQCFSFVAGFTNTGPCTLAVGGLGARSIVADGATLAGGEIVAGLAVVVMYDGTQFQLVSRPAFASLPVAFKNILVNGGLEFFRRGADGAASFAVGASTTAYTADRWYLATGANQAHTVSQQAGLTDRSRFCARIQRNAGQTGTGTVVFGQPFDSDMGRSIRGQIVAISAKVRSGANWSPAAGTLTLSLYVGTGTIAKRVAGFTGETLVASASANLGAGSPVTAIGAVAAAPVPTSTIQGELQFAWTPGGTAGAGDYIEIDNVQLEVGGIVTGFDFRPNMDELMRCMRYYQKSFTDSTAPAQNIGIGQDEEQLVLPTGTSGAFALSIQLPVNLRANPTVTTYNTSATNANWRDTTAGADRAVSILASTGKRLIIGLAGGIAGSTNRINWQADSEV